MAKRRDKVKIAYKEGTWFAVPLENSGYAAGRVARYASNGGILAYLFGPKLTTIPALIEVEHLQPQEAIKVWHIGDLGLLEGKWPVIGDSACWDREKWPVPHFMRKDELSGSAWRVIYSDDDASKVVAEERIPYETTGLEVGGLYGSVAAELGLSRILS
jgi:hypothetical protein